MMIGRAMAIYCLVLAPSTLGFCAVSRPVLVRSLTAAHFRTTGSIAAAAPASERPPYVLTGLPRPQWRGRMMGWAHSTKAWYVLALAYVLAAWRLPSPTPLGAGGLALRVVAAAASSANIRISDGYHNADERAAAGVSDALAPQTETFWLRWDYVGISSVLTSLLWLWSSNFGWVGQLRAVAIAGGVSTALVALISATVVPRKVGHTSVKLIMAVQFVALLGYLCVKCVTSCPANCMYNAGLFWVYAPGLILYVLKKPKSPTFGFHEMFHTSVLAGHVASMALDLRDIAMPCARGVCGI